MAQNRRARHDYDILETYEAGIVLVGSEVKSLREGKAQLRDSYARVHRRRGVALRHARAALRLRRPGSEPPTRTGAGSCCSTAARSTSWAGAPPRTRSPWCRCRSTSRTAGPRSSLALARGRKRYDKRHALAARDADLEARRASAARRRTLDA